MKMKTLLYFTLALSLLSNATARTWSDQEGRTMEAELVRVESDVCVFRKPDGMHYRFALAKLSEADQKYIKENQNESPSEEVAEASSLPETQLTKWLEKRLVARDGTRVKRSRENALPEAEYIGIYFSASWCPPCRKFTPKLVDFYNQQRGQHSNFELIFVSSDSDEDSMEGYMVDYNMPWPAVELDDVKDRTVRQFAGSGIPCLVIVNREGTVLAHSYVNGEYVGPTQAMNKLGELITQ